MMPGNATGMKIYPGSVAGGENLEGLSWAERIVLGEPASRKPVCHASSQCAGSENFDFARCPGTVERLS